jgi:protein-S-isoprenylcysteine O-methyltransferase Ste14
LQKLGSFLFRWRGIVFPLVIVGLGATFPPRLAQTLPERLAIGLGLFVIIAGQSLRALTIGWDYIERGGDHGKVSASRLVTSGMYARCRNPMYVGNILLVAGFLLLFGRWVAGVAGMAFCLLFYRAIVACEERFLEEKFGDEFDAYRQRVPRWRIHLRPLAQTLRLRATDLKAVLLREYSTLSVTTLCALAITIWRLHGRAWHPIELTLLSTSCGIVLGFFLTIRYLKVRRILYVPR